MFSSSYIQSQYLRTSFQLYYKITFDSLLSRIVQLSYFYCDVRFKHFNSLIAMGQDIFQK